MRETVKARNAREKMRMAELRAMLDTPMPVLEPNSMFEWFVGLFGIKSKEREFEHEKAWKRQQKALREELQEIEMDIAARKEEVSNRRWERKEKKEHEKWDREAEENDREIARIEEEFGITKADCKELEIPEEEVLPPEMIKAVDEPSTAAESEPKEETVIYARKRLYE